MSQTMGLPKMLDGRVKEKYVLLTFEAWNYRYSFNKMAVQFEVCGGYRLA